MNKDAVKYLASNISNQPLKVDRLIVTTFLRANDITVKNNKFLQTFLISETDKGEYKKSVEFLSLVKDNGGKFELENVIELFEFVLSPSDRIISGAVYTPKNIREYILDEVFDVYKNNHNSIRIADISSGCGGFLLTAVEKFRTLGRRSFAEIFRTNIFGLDIQDYSVTRTEILLTLLAVSNGEDIDEFEFNLFTGDALEFKWEGHVPKFLGFSAVIGNPPYVCSRNIAPRTKKLLVNWSVSKSGHPDLYIPFFQIGIENLAKGGVLGFITMNSFFKSLNGRAVREYFQSKTLRFKILDFGTEQVFESRNTYTCICIIKNEIGNGIQYRQIGKSQLQRRNIFNIVDYNSLNFTSGWNLQNNDIISKIESTGTPFGSLYKTRNGIATLKNNVYIFTPIKEDKLYYHLSDEYKIEKELCMDIVNPNKLVSISDLRSLKEKIIFPYEYVGGGQ
ncbi:HsdM family class I SAM-dependent methyltransferase [Chryseolinea serpens]|uniref:HsdM family class I SAM-dependent methyltransferase n=1 Tax=Chryseolinea serpens TaxID=947013 RepID=UPI000A8B5A44|nr:N-6 DNA methylase [Chryseolinea serpens]